MSKIRQSRIKILYIIGQLGIGGAERQLLELVKHLDKDRYAPKVCCLSGDTSLAEDIRKTGTEVITFERKHGFEFRRLLQLYRLVKYENPLIVQTSMHSANSYGRIVAKLAQVPIMIASERDIGLDRTWVGLQFDKVLAKIPSQMIVSNSRYGAEWITNCGIDYRKVTIIYNGIDISRFSFMRDIAAKKRQEMGFNPSEAIVGIVAHLTPVKNHECFLLAGRKILNTYPETKFLIVGDGPLRSKLETVSKHLGLSDSVTFTGQRRDVPELMAMLNVFTLCSLSEGMPNAVLEAMAAGKPVVVTNVGGCPEIVEEAKTGFIVPSNDPSAFAEKIMTLLANKELANRMGQTGRKRVEANFTVHKMTRSYEELYENLIQRYVK